MDKTTDWIQLWQELVRIGNRRRELSSGGQGQYRWKQRAYSFNEDVKIRWQHPDSSRSLFLSRITPGSTVLDIGAGSGAWTALAARKVKWVTAVEPDPDMCTILKKNLANEGITNVRLITGIWPEVDVEPHDFSLSSHSMYGCPDLPGFICRMEAVTRRTCFFLIRQPSLHGVMAEAALHVWGHPHDSPNFVVAINVFAQMGIYPNVQIEDSGYWKPWKHDSLEQALAEVKLRLGLEGPLHDAFLQDLLQQRLVFENGYYIWPAATLSAMIYWQPKASKFY